MTEEGMDRAHWSRVADQWIAWARAPNHDAFGAYRKFWRPSSARAAARRWTSAAEKAASRANCGRWDIE